MINLFSSLKYFSILSITTLGCLLNAQIARSETPTPTISTNNSLNLQQQSNFSSENFKINPSNFRQLTSVSNLDDSSIESTPNIIKKPNKEIAQTEIEVNPGATTRSGSSYFGLAGNIGLDGDTTIGQDAFAVISKIGLNDYFSFRPSALVDENATFLLPLTVDFFSKEVSDTGFRVAPYIGGGLSIATGEDDTVGIVVTGGLDIPLSPEFTANTAVNVKFIDSTDLGLLLGVGYNF